LLSRSSASIMFSFHQVLRLKFCTRYPCPSSALSGLWVAPIKRKQLDKEEDFVTKIFIICTFINKHCTDKEI
jgi:hypothetical protein